MNARVCVFLGPPGEKVGDSEAIARRSVEFFVAGRARLYGISGRMRETRVSARTNERTNESFQGEMGLQGERGHPGPIVWSSMKVTVDARTRFR